MQRRFAAILIFAGGIAIGMAFFAEAIGLDNDPGWGRSRFAILIFGSLILVGGIFYPRYAPIIVSLWRKTQSHTVEWATRPLQLIKFYWHTFFVFILVILVYIWFASSGSWIHWRSPTRYYDNLAKGFQAGNLFLPSQPSAELLNLPNPYDPLSRKGIEYPIDYSLYNGRYYLYWGPVPALLVMVIDPFIDKKVGDLYLAFSFICGIFLLQALLAITVWNRFFHDLPKWMLSLSLLLLGLIIPWPYMLVNEPGGRIYEAAISGAQFFLLSGFLMTVIACTKPNPPVLLLSATGILWSLAIGTRLVLALPIGFMSLMLTYWIWKTTSPSRIKFIWKLISLGLPLALSFLGLGWYNWARFGSVTETGFLYGLATMNLQNYRGDIFSPVYLFQNLYNYVLNPPAELKQFPYLRPQEGMDHAILPLFTLSPIYKTNAITGLLFAAPFTVFSILSIIALIKRRGNPLEFAEEDGRNLLRWVITTLLGAYFSAFCFLLIFFWAAMRYMGDFMPSLALVSIFGFWQGYRLFVQKPVYRILYSTIGAFLGIASIILSILLSTSVQLYGLH